LIRNEVGNFKSALLGESHPHLFPKSIIAAGAQRSDGFYPARSVGNSTAIDNSGMRGRRIALSPPRRLLTDLSPLSHGFPRATLLARINVAALMEPRDRARIPWPVVFAKAYALVAAGSPPLRRVYVKLPWPHLYELPQSVASIIVERDWPHDGDSGEKALFLGRLISTSRSIIG
jgi:hypothetical protein